ncbi:MAG: ABC transporter ATP-binding protein [Tannerellaceae bacterium]|jgi:ABC-2 type transport system ATP-binding protein|nr:ABC transporter ATP-binding protein [Tannerellaceae bacterium]
MPAIEIKSLGKTYKGNNRPAIADLSLSIDEGEIFGLLGPNGAGKTTLIHILCCIQTFDFGEVSILGLHLPRRIMDIKPLIGVAPQDIALYPTLTAMENLRVIGGIFGMKRKAVEERATELLDRFGLAANKNRRIDTYSGGMKRRVNLIAALMHRPRIIFLDEPTVGIDVQSKIMILDSLKDINRDGCTIIYTSHYMEEAENLCTRVGIIDEGHILQSGHPCDLVRSSGCASLENLYLQLTGKTLRDDT